MLSGKKLSVEDQEFIDRLVHNLQQENWSMLKNNCFHKSIKFYRVCRARGLDAHILVGIGIQITRRPIRIPFLSAHARGWVDGVEYEVSNDHDFVSVFGTNAHEYTNIIGIWI